MTTNWTRKYKKTIAILIFLANRDKRLYWILKSLWLAERKHLEKYGNMITGDSYIAMSHGPVPSLAYDIVKDARGIEGYDFENPDPREVISAPDVYTVLPLIDADTRLLSQSELECIIEAHEFLAPKSFEEVKELSHTPAFEAAQVNDEIPFDAFVRDLKNGEEVLSYLKSV